MVRRGLTRSAAASPRIGATRTTNAKAVKKSKTVHIGTKKVRVRSVNAPTRAW